MHLDTNPSAQDKTDFKTLLAHTMAQSSKTANTVLVPDLEKLRLDENKVSGDPENPTDTSKNASNAPNGAYGAAMASFRGSRPRIRRLLDCLNLEGFDSGSVEIEPIQHGAEFTNCVYGLVPASSSTEQLILRVVVKNSQGLAPDARNEGLESDIALLSFLKDKLPVPQIKAYDLTTDNALKAAYTIQTRIPGHSLNHLWEQMDQSEKCDIIDEFIVLLAKLESIEFPAAGYFDVKAPLPAKKDDFSGTIDVVVHHFVAVSDGSLQDPKVSEDRAGIDIEKLLKSLLDDWIKQYQIEDDPPAVTIFKNLLTMGSDMEKEGYFKEQRPIVLHHWGRSFRAYVAVLRACTLTRSHLQRLAAAICPISLRPCYLKK